MTKTSFIIVAFLIGTAFTNGCNRNNDSDSYLKFTTNKPSHEYAKTGDVQIDGLLEKVTVNWILADNFLTQYMDATNNSREYYAFTRLIEKKTLEGLDDATAFKAARKDIIAEDKANRKNKNYVPIWPIIQKSHDAVEALKPQNQIDELLILIKNVDGLLADCKKLATPSSITLSKMITIFSKDNNSVTNILSKAKYTAEALLWLKAQYEYTIRLKKYMAHIK